MLIDYRIINTLLLFWIVIVEAKKLNCDIITVPTGILNKINLLGKNLDIYSLETVKMFYQDAKKAGFKLW